MKVKLTTEQIKYIVADPTQAAAAGVKVSDPWWVIVLKVVKYICELLIASAGVLIATSCANYVGIL